MLRSLGRNDKVEARSRRSLGRDDTTGAPLALSDRSVGITSVGLPVTVSDLPYDAKHRAIGRRSQLPNQIGK